MYRFESVPQIKNVSVKNDLKPIVKYSKIKKNLENLIKKYKEVITIKAKNRYAVKLREAGINIPINDISVDEIRDIFYPFFIVILKKQQRERVLAIDGINKQINKKISEILTRNLKTVIDSIRGSIYS